MGQIGRPIVLPIAAGLLVLSLFRIFLRSDDATRTPPLTLDVKRAQFDGRMDADTVLVILSDLECAKCQTFATQVLPKIESHYVAPGLLRLAFLYTANGGSTTEQDQALVRCLDQQRLFWRAYPALFTVPASARGIPETVQGTEKLDSLALRNCISGYPPEEPIDIGHLLPTGGAGLPLFLIGPINKSLVIEARGVIGGGAPFEVFNQTFTALGLGQRR